MRETRARGGVTRSRRGRPSRRRPRHRTPAPRRAVRHLGRRSLPTPQGEGMEDYEDGAEEPVSPAAAETLEVAVRPALVAATRLFLVAGAVLVVVDERGGLAWAARPRDLAEVPPRTAGQLWAGPGPGGLAQ